MTPYIIYKITNTLNGLGYVGNTSMTFEARSFSHIHASNGKSSMLIHLAMKEYGVQHFIFEILETIKDGNSIQAGRLERKWAKKEDTVFPRGYNSPRMHKHK